MSSTIYAKLHGWAVEVQLTESVGCCGIGTLYGLGVLSHGEKRYKDKVLAELKKNILHASAAGEYGILQLTALGEIYDWSMSFWRYTDTRHDATFNLGDLARYMRMKKGHSTRNPKTGNEIIMYSKVVGTYDEGCF